MKKLAFVLALALASPVYAGYEVLGYSALRYDLDSTTMTYCVARGANGGVFGQVGPKTNDYLLDSASTAVTADTAGTALFTGMAVGDVLFIRSAGVIYPRTILTYTDSETLVSDEALTADGVRFDWVENDCGTGVTNGWVMTAGWDHITVAFFMKQYVGDGNGVDIRLEGAVLTPDGTTNVIQLWPSKTVGAAATVQNLTTAGIASNLAIEIASPVQAVRLGMKHNTADDGNDLTTNAEQFTVVVYGRQGQ